MNLIAENLAVTPDLFETSAKRDSRPASSVMLNLFQHPTLFKNNNMHRVQPCWTLKQVQGDGEFCRGLDLFRGPPCLKRYRSWMIGRRNTSGMTEK